jgi:hypothetical protein
MPMPRRDSRPTQSAELEADIAALEELAANAESDKAYSPAVTARSRLPSLRAELHRLRDLEVLVATSDPLERIRRTRAIAEREGSWQAVARLASVEADLEVRLAEARAAEEAAKLSNLSTDDLLEYITAAIDQVPANLRAELLDRLMPA